MRIFFVFLLLSPSLSLGSSPDWRRCTFSANDIIAISAMLEMYRNDRGSYPTNEQGLSILNSAGYARTDEFRNAWNFPYVYVLSDDNQYTLMSYGADNTPGGEYFDSDFGKDDDLDSYIEGCKKPWWKLW